MPVALLLWATMAQAAGFQLNLQGLRQLGMGGGGVALPWDASTIFYNPAGLSRLDGVQVSASMLLIMANAQFVQSAPTGNYSVRTASQKFTPFNLYVGGPIKKDGKIGVGLGIYTPFGSGTKWPDDWAGRYMAQSITLESIFIQPTASYKINDMLSVGAGFVYAYGNLKFAEALPLQDMNGVDGQANLKGSANGVGYNLGVNIKATEKLKFGISYRSGVKMNLSNGTANFTVPSSLASSFPNTTFKSSVPLPQVLCVGVGYNITEKLTGQFDLEYVGWHTYDSLRFDFTTHTAELQNNHSPRHYKNTLAYRLGFNYAFTPKISAMVGGAWDPSPVPDGFVSPELPDANRIVLTCGVAYAPIKKLSIIAAMEYTTTAKRNAAYNYDNFSGTYQTKAITPGLGINYSF